MKFKLDSIDFCCNLSINTRLINEMIAEINFYREIFPSHFHTRYTGYDLKSNETKKKWKRYSRLRSFTSFSNNRRFGTDILKFSFLCRGLNTTLVWFTMLTEEAQKQEKTRGERVARRIERQTRMPF